MLLLLSFLLLVMYFKLCLKHGNISPETCCPELSTIFRVRPHLKVAHQRDFGLRASPLPLIGTQERIRISKSLLCTPVIQPKPSCEAAGTRYCSLDVSECCWPKLAPRGLWCCKKRLKLRGMGCYRLPHASLAGLGEPAATWRFAMALPRI